MGDTVTRKRRRDGTEWLLTYLGPAQVGNIRASRRALTADERGREESLREEFVRVTGPDGRTFLEQRTEHDA